MEHHVGQILTSYLTFLLRLIPIQSFSSTKRKRRKDCPSFINTQETMFVNTLINTQETMLVNTDFGQTA